MIYKKIFLYILGLFVLSVGVNISIHAALGVSPVSSLSYALALSFPLSIGITTIIANVIFLIVQMLISKRFDPKYIVIQAVITVIFGITMDITSVLVNFLPVSSNLFLSLIYLFISLPIVAVGFMFYLHAGLSLMPYDMLIHEISQKSSIPFAKVKIYGDFISVIISLLICFIMIQSLGAIGLGTFIAAYAIGKTLALIMPFKKYLLNWLYGSNEATF